MACQQLLDELRTHHAVEVVNLSKSDLRHGISSPARVAQVVSILRDVRGQYRNADVIYLTISESVAGNLKDLAIYAACGTHRSRMVIHLHGGAGIRGLLQRGIFRALNARYLRELGGVVVLGQSMTDIFRGMVSPSRLHVVPNCAEDELFVPRPAIERKFANAKPLRVLFLSNLIPGKGHGELADALRMLDAQVRARIHVDFAGGFDSAEHQREFLDRIKTLACVRFHGVVKGDARQRLLAEAHVLCLPTYYAYEGQPLALIEAYASGCAVITTDHSGIRDIFAPDVNGLQVAARSAQSIASALESALASPQRLLEMARTNREQAERHHRRERHVRRLVEILENVAARA